MSGPTPARAASCCPSSTEHSADTSSKQLKRVSRLPLLPPRRAALHLLNPYCGCSSSPIALAICVLSPWLRQCQPPVCMWHCKRRASKGQQLSAKAEENDSAEGQGRRAAQRGVQQTPAEGGARPGRVGNSAQRDRSRGGWCVLGMRISGTGKQAEAVQSTALAEAACCTGRGKGGFHGEGRVCGWSRQW